MLYCIRNDLVYFRLGDVFRIYAAYRSTLVVYFEHDLSRLFRRHAEERLQHLDHEFHRGVIIVQ